MKRELAAGEKETNTVLQFQRNPSEPMIELNHALRAASTDFTRDDPWYASLLTMNIAAVSAPVSSPMGRDWRTPATKINGCDQRRNFLSFVGSFRVLLIN